MTKLTDKLFDTKVRKTVTERALARGLHITTPENDEGTSMNVTITGVTFSKDVRRNPLAEFRKAVKDANDLLKGEGENAKFLLYNFSALYDGEIDTFTATQALMRMVSI